MSRHTEIHRTHRIGWLRAAAIGAFLPLLLVFFVPRSALLWTVSGGSRGRFGRRAIRDARSFLGRHGHSVVFWGRVLVWNGALKSAE